MDSLTRLSVEDWEIKSQKID